MPFNITTVRSLSLQCDVCGYWNQFFSLSAQRVKGVAMHAGWIFEEHGHVHCKRCEDLILAEPDFEEAISDRNQKTNRASAGWARGEDA